MSDARPVSQFTSRCWVEFEANANDQGFTVWRDGVLQRRVDGILVDDDTSNRQPKRPSQQHVYQTQVYFCPTSGETEHPTMSGFNQCCDRMDLHRPPTHEERHHHG